jgi:hypothetical protein
LANAGNSNTPTGPFHSIVCAFVIVSTSIATDFGPMSRIMSSAATSSTALMAGLAVSLNSFATTTSIGSGM